MNNRGLVYMAIGIIATAAAGTLIWDFLFEAQGQRAHDTILGLTVFTIAMITFFGFMKMGQNVSRSWSWTKGGLRTAIASTIVVTYLFMVCFQIFFTHGSDVDPIKQTFMDSFTAIAGITIAFYFGASAALQALGKDDEAEKGSVPKNEEGKVTN